MNIVGLQLTNTATRLWLAY